MAAPKVKLRHRKGNKGTSYFIDFTLNGKRNRLAVGSNKKKAEEIRREYDARLLLGQLSLPSQIHDLISLKDLSKRFIASKKNYVRGSSLKRYQNYLDKIIEYMDEYFPAPSLNVREIKTTYIEESFNNLIEIDKSSGKRWEPKTVNGLRTLLIQLFNYGVKLGYLSNNPAKETKKFREPGKKVAEFFTDDDLDKIWENLDEYWIDHLKFIVHTGLRKGELINLQWNNVNLKGPNPNIVIVSSGSWQTKTGESRVIPLNNTSLNIIKRQKGKSSVYVFTQKNGLKIHPDRPYHAMKKALKIAGLEGDIHKLRHTFASKLVMKGEDLYTVSKLLGHSDTKTTQIYAHLAPDYLKSAVDKLDEEGE